jgi:hypothetical protein
LRQRGQKIDVFVLGRRLKLDLSTSTPVDTWCPVVGHTKTIKAIGKTLYREDAHRLEGAHALYVSFFGAN